MKNHREKAISHRPQNREVAAEVTLIRKLNHSLRQTLNRRIRTLRRHAIALAMMRIANMSGIIDAPGQDLVVATVPGRSKQSVEDEVAALRTIKETRQLKVKIRIPRHDGEIRNLWMEKACYGATSYG
jgi:hypothetical protein